MTTKSLHNEQTLLFHASTDLTLLRHSHHDDVLLVRSCHTKPVMPSMLLQNNKLLNVISSMKAALHARC